MTRVSFLAGKFEQVPYYNTIDIWQIENLEESFKVMIRGPGLKLIFFFLSN